MKKIVINNDYGGFGISPLGIAKLEERKNVKMLFYNPVKRHDPDLVELVEEYGELMNGFHASLQIVSIPEYFDYEIDEYDGAESVITVYNVTEEQLLQGLSKEQIALAKQADKICIAKLQNM